MEFSLRARNCRQHGAREKDMCEREKYMSYSTVMRKRRYRAREKDMCELVRERGHILLSVARCLSLSHDIGACALLSNRTDTSLARTSGTCLSLSRDVADSFEAVTLRQ